jgi:hypothetical protein
MAMTIHAEFGFISLESFEKTFVIFAYGKLKIIFYGGSHLGFSHHDITEIC